MFLISVTGLSLELSIVAIGVVCTFYTALVSDVEAIVEDCTKGFINAVALTRQRNTTNCVLGNVISSKWCVEQFYV